MCGDRLKQALFFLRCFVRCYHTASRRTPERADAMQKSHGARGFGSAFKEIVKSACREAEWDSPQRSPRKVSGAQLSSYERFFCQGIVRTRSRAAHQHHNTSPGEPRATHPALICFMSAWSAADFVWMDARRTGRERDRVEMLFHHRVRADDQTLKLIQDLVLKKIDMFVHCW